VNIAVRSGIALRVAAALWLLLVTAGTAVAAPLTIAWDKSADTQVRGYMVFVGNRPGDPLSAFDVGNATSFQFSTGSASGTLYFSVASYGDDHVPGTRSHEVSATLGGGAAAPATGSAQVAAMGEQAVSSVPQRACFDAGQCYVAAPLLHSSMRVGSLAVDPFGQLYFVEGDSRVRVVSATGASEVVLDAADVGARILGLAVDPQFVISRSVFVAEASAREQGTFDIARYRNIANRFGEHAVLVPGLPTTASPLLTLDGAAHIFAVLPAASPSRLGYGGLVLRYNSDGSVPRENPLGSPIFSRGYDEPTAAVVDAQNDTLLLTGSNRGATADVVQLPTDQAAHPPVASQVLLTGRDQIIRARRLADASYQLSSIAIPGAVSVAAAPDGRLYVAVSSPDGGTDIVRLDRVEQ